MKKQQQPTAARAAARVHTYTGYHPRTIYRRNWYIILYFISGSLAFLRVDRARRPQLAADGFRVRYHDNNAAEDSVLYVDFEIKGRGSSPIEEQNLILLSTVNSPDHFDRRGPYSFYFVLDHNAGLFLRDSIVVRWGMA